MSNALGPWQGLPSGATHSPPPGPPPLTTSSSDPLPPAGSPGPLRSDPWVKALFNFSQTVAAKRRSPRRPPSGPVAAPPARETPLTYSLAEAAPQLANPLAPLRDRDRQALGALFTHDQMATIEADILTRLSHLVPEPIWEVEPYEFLREFL